MIQNAIGEIYRSPFLYYYKEIDEVLAKLGL